MPLATLPSKQHLQVVIYRTKAILTAEGSLTYLNFLWWVIEPLLELCMFYVVLGLILQRGGPGFITELLSGIFIVRFFIAATTGSPNYLLNSGQLLLSVNIPKYILPAAHTLTYFFKFLFLLCLLYIFLLALGVSPKLGNLAIFPLTVLYFAFTLGITMLLSGMAPFVPDLAVLYPKITMLIFWGSGVFFLPEKYLPPEYVFWFNANPVAGFISAYRDCLLRGTINYNLVGYLAVVSLIMLAAGYLLLARFDKKYPRLVM